MVAVDQLMIVTGQLLAFSINALIANNAHDSTAWRDMLLACSLPAVFLWIAMSRMPESARWLAARGRLAAAIGSLKRVRREDNAGIAAEIAQFSRPPKGRAEFRDDGWGALRVRWVRRVVLIGVGIAILQQTTGINTIMYYAPKILMAAGQGETASITAQVANGVISVAGSACGIWFVRHLPRRGMLVAGQAGVIASLAAIAVIFWTQVEPHMLADGSPNPASPPSEMGAYAALAGMMLFLFFNQGLQAPANWVLLSEIFPMAIRGFGMGLATFCLWMVNALITWAFPVMIAAIGGGSTFAVFAAINVVTIIFSIVFVPETRNLSLEQLERHLKARYS
jgi:major inositol transporter-like SP family MFS transporter